MLSVLQGFNDPNVGENLAFLRNDPHKALIPSGSQHQISRMQPSIAER
jgi:hypothetical protein